MSRSLEGVPGPLSLAAGRELLSAALLGRGNRVERAGLFEAQSRFLAEAATAAFAVPEFANSAMDGYALRSADSKTGENALGLHGRSLAGSGSPPALPPGSAMRITTGAVLPAGADAVIIQENCRVEGETLHFSGVVDAGANVRQVGEDWASGAAVLAAGTRIGPVQLALLAAIGKPEVRVCVAPRVAIITTGDELLVPGQARRPGQIYDSNGPMLAGLVDSCGGLALPPVHVRDDPQLLLDALRRSALASDLIVTVGGASVGDADYLPQLLREHGHVHFWKLKLKPGMPCLFGELDGCPVLSLPGNPVSAFSSFLVLGRFALRLLLGVNPADPPTVPVQLSRALSKRHARMELQRCRLHWRDGQLFADPLQAQGSHQLSGLRDADGLLLLPEGALEWPAGQLARAWRIGDWLA